MDIEWIDENLIEATYFFCYKKLGNSHDAEDLTQDILLETIKAIRRGQSFVSFYSWFWATANNRVNMFFRMKRFHAVELDSVAGIPESGDYLNDDLIKAEEIGELNYLISRLSHLHREVIIMYYLKGMKIPEIALNLAVPEGTVKTRLHDAKKAIKKGVSDMQNKTGRSAYAPADLQLIGGYGAPKYWEAIQDLISKQIFAVCANKAMTVREIADEIGVAPVYFEEKLRYLLDNKFVKETSKGKYITDFIIYPEQMWLDYLAKLSEVLDPIGPEITKIILENENVIRSVGFYGSDFSTGTLLWILYYFAAWAMMDRMFSLNEDEWKDKVPHDNGKDYRMSGHVKYPDENPVYNGKNNSVSWSNLHNNFKTSGYKLVEHANLFQAAPFGFRDSIINEANVDLFMRIFDNPFIELTSNEKEFAANLISSGYLVKRDGGLYPTMPIMTYEQQQIIRDILNKAVEPLCKKYLRLVISAAEHTVREAVRADLLEEYAHWTLLQGFFPLQYMLYYGMYSEEKPLEIPDDYSATSKAVCIYIRK
ncbi:MAG: sigma-70 family RNA polymerase sigma factor [Clostridia bacterium]|nr:sigma-70 family RNA polymerase sigma factor [Clostridia bacterium]